MPSYTYHLKNVLHNRGGFRIDDQLMVVVRVFQIPIRGESSDKLSLAALHIQNAADFDWCLVAMLVVHVALHLGGNAADFFGPQVAVQCWKLYGDKTNIQRNEHIFQIVTAFIVISGQSGKVFDDYAVNFFSRRCRTKAFENPPGRCRFPSGHRPDSRLPLGFPGAGTDSSPVWRLGSQCCNLRRARPLWKAVCIFRTSKFFCRSLWMCC